MPSVEEVLAFVRDADEETRGLVIREMNRTRNLRNERAARFFCIGELVRFQPLDNRGQPMEGRTVKVGRRRVILAVANESEFVERVSVPASLVVRIF